MSDRPIDPQGPDSLFTADAALEEAFTRTHRLVLELEPLARDLNRILTDAFGPHPTSTDGTWTYIEQCDDDSYLIGLESLLPQHVFVVSDILRRSLSAAFASGDVSRTNLAAAVDIGPSIVGEAAQLRSVPPVHVRVERRS